MNKWSFQSYDWDFPLLIASQFIVSSLPKTKDAPFLSFIDVYYTLPQTESKFAPWNRQKPQMRESKKSPTQKLLVSGRVMFLFWCVFAAILWFKDFLQISSKNSGVRFNIFQHWNWIYNRQPPQKFLVDMTLFFYKRCGPFTLLKSQLTQRKNRQRPWSVGRRIVFQWRNWPEHIEIQKKLHHTKMV